jgi:hypothetical protein
MYKYSKLVKEKLFQDNYMAFLWMYYRLVSAVTPKIMSSLKVEENIKAVIFSDFDRLAMNTLHKGPFALCCYIFQI